MNRTTVLIALVVAALAASACAALAQDEQVTLAYKFRTGEIVHYHMTMDGSGTIEMAGMPEAPGAIPIDMSMEMVMRQKIAGIAADGTATIAQQIEKMTIDQTVMGQKMKTVISDKGMTMTVNGKPMPKGAGMPDFKNMPMFGKAIMVKTRPTGEVVKIEGLDTGEMAKMMKQMGFDFNQFNQMLTSGSAVFPEHAVMVGETWEQRVKLPFSAADPNKPLEVVTNYRLEEVGEVKGEPTARISSSTFQDLSGMKFEGGGGMMMPGMKIDRMAIQMNGVMLWSLKRGMMTRTDFDMIMDMGMSMTMPAEAGGGNMQMSVTMNLNGVMVLKP